MTLAHRLIALSVILLCVGVEYGSHLRSAGFVYEDYLWTEACQQGIDLNDRVGHVRGIPRTGALMSWCWELRQGDSARSFHVVNLALHGLVSFLVGILMFQLTASEPVAWAVAALFVTHPLGIESAGYLAGRGELIAAAGVVLACIAALSGEWMAMLWSVFFGVLGKESAMVALIAVPLVLAMNGRLSAGFVALATCAVLGMILAVILAVNLIELPIALWIQWALLQATAFVRLTILAILPIGQTPSHDYRGIGIGWQAVSLGFMGWLALMAWRKRINDRLFAGGLAWLVLTTLPRLIVPTPPSLLNEHQFYVPLIGVMVCGASVMVPRAV